MPIAGLTQPTSDSIHAAYRPVSITAIATATGGGSTPPVVYCDVYFNDVFHKTLTATVRTGTSTVPFGSTWQFDLQRSAQEYLATYLSAPATPSIERATPLMLKAFCRFRSSDYDADGFIAPEGTAPVQATSSTPAVDGDGTESNSFYILNATLQHEDNQQLSLHLDSYKTGTWAATTYPLTHRPAQKVYLGDSDTFPIVHLGAEQPAVVRLHYKLKDAAAYEPASDKPTSAGAPALGVYYIPAGPANLAALFDPLDFATIAEYYIEVVDVAEAVIATTPVYTIKGAACSDRHRLHFVNYLGAVDSVAFKRLAANHSVKSSTFTRPLATPMVKSAHSLTRESTTAGEGFKLCSSAWPEEAQPWLAELAGSPLAWMAWTGTQGQANDYLPLVIADATVDLVKQDERHTYELKLEAKLSNQKILIRP